MQVFNAATQQLEDVDFSVDGNDEIVAKFKDGSFLKFPAGLSEAELEEQIDAHQEANEGQEVITPEMEAEAAAKAAASKALVDKLNGNTMPEEDKTDAPQDDTDR